MSRWGAAPAGLKIARIDIDPAEMRRLQVDVPIVADSADAARALAAAVAPRSDAARAEAIARAKAEAAAGDPEGAAADVVPRGDPRRAAGERHPVRRDDAGRLRLLVRLPDPCAAHADHLRLLRHARRRLPDRARRQGGDARPAGGGADRRRRLPVRRRRTRDRGAVRHQPGDRAVQQLVLRQRAARSAAAVRGPRFRLRSCAIRTSRPTPRASACRPGASTTPTVCAARCARRSRRMRPR